MRGLPAVAAIAVVFAVACVASPSDHYQRGSDAAAKEDWPTAVAEFEAAGTYQDAHQRYLDALLADADERAKADDLDAAVPLLQRAGAYRDAEQRLKVLQGNLTVLSILYDQMRAAADAGDRKSALARSAQIVQIAPNFRDVKAKRAEYLDALYSLAMRSMAQADWRSAIAYLTLITQEDPTYKDVASKLVQARVEGRKPLPGAYSIGTDFRDGDWQGDVRGLIVEADLRITVSVDWTNSGFDARPARCTVDRRANPPALIFEDGTHWLPIGTSCSLGPGEMIDPLGSFSESATFPAISDGTRPFRIDWYGFVTTAPIRLVS